MEKFEISSNEFKTPEGGWGYVIIAAFIIMNWVSLIPFVIFPLLYGDHLARLGDEASQTAMAIQVFMGLVSLASCFAGFSISRYGYRITGLSGAISFLIGALGEHFGTSFAHIIIFTSVFKGTGFGLMEMSSITILNVYFDKNLNFAMGICQVFIAIGTIAGPPQTTFLIGTIGVKNTIWIYTGLSLLNFPAMATFRPVTSHKERDPIASLPYEEGKTAAQAPLLQVDKENELDVGRVTKMWNSTKTWILDDFGFRLFMRLKFWIITLGLGVAYISDVLFYHLIRATLKSLNFTPEDISLSMMIFIVTDICGRLGYTILSRFWTLKNSYIFLTASIFINACRIMYFLRDDYKWRTITIGMVGGLRAFIQTPLTLVINENYKNNFPKAFSMYSVLSGLVSLSLSSLAGFIKSYAGDDALVVCVYAGINYFCCLTWFLDIFYGIIWKWFSSRRKIIVDN